MTPKFVKRAAASMGIAALVSASVLVGATSAQAGSPLNDCFVPSSIGTAVDLQTPGAWWYDVCLNTGDIGEGETTNKTDAFDGFGNIYATGNPDAISAVPTSYGYVGSDYVITFTDPNFDVGLADNYDVVVTQTFSGTFVSWKVEFFIAGTSTPANGLPISINGNLGCDSACEYGFDGAQMVTSGDQNDPIIMWQVDTDYIWNATDGNDDVEVEFLSGGTLTVGLVDFSCGPIPMTSYISDLLDDGLSTHFGESLQVPGTVTCVTVSPLEVTTGQAFDLVVPLTLPAPPWDWTSGGGAGLDDEPDFVSDEGLNENDPGIAPGLRVFGTAPTTPGVYTMPVYIDSNAGVFSRGFLTITVVAPTLAATGVDAAVPLAAGLGATVLGALALVLVRRRTLTEN